MTKLHWSALEKEDTLKNWREQRQVTLYLSFVIKEISGWEVITGQGRDFVC